MVGAAAVQSRHGECIGIKEAMCGLFERQTRRFSERSTSLIPKPSDCEILRHAFGKGGVHAFIRRGTINDVLSTGIMRLGDSGSTQPILVRLCSLI
jgi:hypothetical protein